MKIKKMAAMAVTILAFAFNLKAQTIHVSCGTVGTSTNSFVGIGTGIFTTAYFI